MRARHDGQHWSMNRGEFLLSKLNSQSDRRERRIPLSPRFCDVVRHPPSTLREGGGAVTNSAEDYGRKRLTRFKCVDLMSDIDHIHYHVRLRRIVERIAVNGFEINEPRNLVWMEGSDPAQLFAGNGLAGQNRPVEF